MSEPKYTYPPAAEFEAKWIETHRRHRVEISTGNWIVCRTCASPPNLTTMDPYAVMRELQTRDNARDGR